MAYCSPNANTISLGPWRQIKLKTHRFVIFLANIHYPIHAYHLCASILESLGVDGERTDQLLGGEVNLNLPAVALHSHLIKIALRVRISHLDFNARQQINRISSLSLY